MRELTILPFLTLLAAVGYGSENQAVNSSFIKVPESFEPNLGQADPGVDYIVRGPGYSLSLASGDAFLNLVSDANSGIPVKSANIHVKMVGSNHNAHVQALDRQVGKSNYFIGKNPNLWRRDLPHYGRVEYSGIYPGIDLAYYGAAEQLEYDFVVQSTANPRTIRLGFEGAERIYVDGGGDLVLTVGSSEIRERKPVSYQETAQGRRPVDVRYILLRNKQVGFRVGSYDPALPLVIDPELVYSTYLGTINNDLAYRVVLDAQGNAYYGGLSKAPTSLWPGPTVNQIGAVVASGGTANMIAKVSPSGVLLYTTFIGGTNDRGGIGGIAVDGSGNVYATGPTWSADFPLVLDPRGSKFAGGNDDVFVLELNSIGNSLIFSTLIGGSGNDSSTGLRIDNLGDIYITGSTTSTDFPIKNAFQSSLVGSRNAFVTALAPGGTSLLYSTYLGGGSEFSNNMVIDGTHNVYVFGDTGAANFPTKNAYIPNICSGTNGHGWLSEFSPSGSLLYSTFICGAVGYDTVRGAALDSSGNLILTGATASTSFPITSNARQTSFGGGPGDAFIMQLNLSGGSAGLLYSTYFGGTGDDVGRGVVLDSVGNWYITGETASPNFFTFNPPPGSGYGGGYDAFLTKINTSGSVVFSTFLGGNGTDNANDLAVDANGRAYLAGQTTSTNFPTVNAFQTTFGGGTGTPPPYDAFLAAIATCDFALSTPGTVPVGGGSGSVSITTTPECGWTATSSNTWITPTSTSGVGSGTISFAVAANTTGSPRSGTLTIGGLTVNVSQSVATPFLTSITPNSGSLGGTVSVTLVGTNLYGTSIATIPGITISGVTVTSTSITATFAISNTASLGTQSVTVNSGSVTSNSLPFTINPAPSLTSITPNTGAQGQTVGITLGGLNLSGASINVPTGITVSTVAITSTSITANFTISATAPTGVQNVTVTVGGAKSSPVTFTVNPTGLLFVPITPCRVLDTRNPTGPFGGPYIGPSSPSGQTRSFTIPNSSCSIPSTAQAYSFNVAVVPHGALGYLTVWPSGQTRPSVATLNSIDGRVKSNAAIVPAGPGSGAISLYATNDTDVVLDINGYYVPAGTSPGAELAFYPLTPCRLVDTRSGHSSALGTTGGAFAGGTSRTLPLANNCGLPSTAKAYSLNFTVVAPGQVGFLTAYPTGVSRPVVATLNAVPPLPLTVAPVVVANAALVPADTGGNIDVYATNTTDLVVDINGYFALPGAGGLSLYNLPPCRVLDTRTLWGPGSPPFTGKLDVNVLGSGCGGTPQTQAYVFNATVVPSSYPPGLGYLTLWPQAITQPTVATLNALDGAITNNMAIVPTNNTEVSSYATNSTQLILDMFGYFAP